MILAIDPTWTHFGYALIDDFLQVADVGVFTTEKDKNKKTRVSDDDSFRTQQMVTALGQYVLKNGVKGIMGERPSGSQTAAALKSFCIGNAIVDCISALMNIPVEFCTPNETKKGAGLTGTASKKDIMVVISEQQGWKITKKSINTKKGVRIDNVYYPLGRKMGGGQFEHIADAIAAFQWLKPASQIVKFNAKNALVA